MEPLKIDKQFMALINKKIVWTKSHLEDCREYLESARNEIEKTIGFINTYIKEFESES